MKKLKDKNLHNWRHKFVGHKDIENAADTEIMYLNFIKADFVHYSKALINDINSFVIKEYGVQYNNTFASLYSKSFNRRVCLFEKELVKQNNI